jgi:GNAT superfamily N-acetyltransferase
MSDVRELREGETHLAAAAMLELRPQHGDAAGLISRADAQRAAGYRLVGAFAGEQSEAVAVAGFRIGENLAWGRFLYVDDLSTAARFRGQGHAGALFRWLHAEARREGCDELHLDSGVGPEREAAHRFYFNHGLRIASHHFTSRL